MRSSGGAPFDLGKLHAVIERIVETPQQKGSGQESQLASGQMVEGGPPGCNLSAALASSLRYLLSKGIQPSTSRSSGTASVQIISLRRDSKEAEVNELSGGTRGKNARSSGVHLEVDVTGRARIILSNGQVEVVDCGTGQNSDGGESGSSSGTSRKNLNDNRIIAWLSMRKRFQPTIIQLRGRNIVACPLQIQERMKLPNDLKDRKVRTKKMPRVLYGKQQAWNFKLLIRRDASDATTAQASIGFASKMFQHSPFDGDSGVADEGSSEASKETSGEVLEEEGVQYVQLELAARTQKQVAEWNYFLSNGRSQHGDTSVSGFLWRKQRGLWNRYFCAGEAKSLLWFSLDTPISVPIDSLTHIRVSTLHKRKLRRLHKSNVFARPIHLERIRPPVRKMSFYDGNGVTLPVVSYRSSVLTTLATRVVAVIWIAQLEANHNHPTAPLKNEASQQLENAEVGTMHGAEDGGSATISNLVDHHSMETFLREGSATIEREMHDAKDDENSGSQVWARVEESPLEETPGTTKLRNEIRDSIEKALSEAEKTTFGNRPMLPPSNGAKKNYYILSIDGGGARGVIPVAILMRLVEVFPDLMERFDLFAGISSGSMTASQLATGRSPAFVRKMIELTKNLVLQPREVRKFQGYPLRQAKYSHQMLAVTGEELFHTTSLADCPRSLLIVTFCLDNHAPDEQRSWEPRVHHNLPLDPTNHPVRSYAGGKTNNTSDNANQAVPVDKNAALAEWCNLNPTSRICELVSASCAAPTFFPSYRGHVDGGVVTNDPALAAIATVLSPEVLGTPKVPGQIHVLSLGCGAPPQYVETHSDLDWGIIQWMPWLAEMLICSSELYSVQLCKAMLSDNHHRVNPRVHKPIPMDDPAEIPMLEEIANKMDLTTTIDWIKRHLYNDEGQQSWRIKACL